IRELLANEFKVERSEIDFEKRIPEVRGRLDAILGRALFEVKSDLNRERQDAENRIPDYLGERQRETGERYTAIATDGLLWIAYELRDGSLIALKEWRLDNSKPEKFLAELEGALALGAELPPDPETIRLELGGESVAFRRAAADLAEIWSEVK